MSLHEPLSLAEQRRWRAVIYRYLALCMFDMLPAIESRSEADYFFLTTGANPVTLMQKRFGLDPDDLRRGRLAAARSIREGCSPPEAAPWDRVILDCIREQTSQVLQAWGLKRSEAEALLVDDDLVRALHRLLAASALQPRIHRSGKTLVVVGFFPILAEHFDDVARVVRAMCTPGGRSSWASLLVAACVRDLVQLDGQDATLSEMLTHLDPPAPMTGAWAGDGPALGAVAQAVRRLRLLDRLGLTCHTNSRWKEFLDRLETSCGGAVERGANEWTDFCSLLRGLARQGQPLLDVDLTEVVTMAAVLAVRCREERHLIKGLVLGLPEGCWGLYRRRSKAANRRSIKKALESSRAPHGLRSESSKGSEISLDEDDAGKPIPDVRHGVGLRPVIDWQPRPFAWKKHASIYMDFIEWALDRPDTVDASEISLPLDALLASLKDGDVDDLARLLLLALRATVGQRLPVPKAVIPLAKSAEIVSAALRRHGPLALVRRCMELAGACVDAQADAKVMLQNLVKTLTRLPAVSMAADGNSLLDFILGCIDVNPLLQEVPETVTILTMLHAARDERPPCRSMLAHPVVFHALGRDQNWKSEPWLSECCLLQPARQREDLIRRLEGICPPDRLEELQSRISWVHTMAQSSENAFTQCLAEFLQKAPIAPHEPLSVAWIEVAAAAAADWLDRAADDATGEAEVERVLRIQCQFIRFRFGMHEKLEAEQHVGMLVESMRFMLRLLHGRPRVAPSEMKFDLWVPSVESGSATGPECVASLLGVAALLACSYLQHDEDGRAFTHDMPEDCDLCRIAHLMLAALFLESGWGCGRHLDLKAGDWGLMLAGGHGPGDGLLPPSWLKMVRAHLVAKSLEPSD